MNTLSNEDIVKKALAEGLGGWVPVAQYLLVSGEKVQSIRDRLRKGTWQRGVHYQVPPGSQAWVNLFAIRQWVEAEVQKKADENLSKSLAKELSKPSADHAPE